MCMTTELDCCMTPICPRRTCSLKPVATSPVAVNALKYPPVRRGRKKKMTAPRMQMKDTRTGEATESEKPIRRAVSEAPVADDAAAWLIEWRISIRMQVTTAANMKIAKVSRKRVLTVSTDATSTIRNESTARK